MQKYQRTYYNYFNYGVQDFVPCELMGVKSNEIHHIQCRGMGGRPLNDMDDIGNLMAISRLPHDLLGDNENWNAILQEAHDNFMISQTPFIVEDPFHKIFDFLLSSIFGKIILDKRRESKFNKNILV